MSPLERSPSYRESNKGSKEKQGPRCPFYRGVRLIEVSMKRELTVYLLLVFISYENFKKTLISSAPLSMYFQGN